MLVPKPPQEIAKVTTRGVSVWDVHMQVKDGEVDFSDSPFGDKLSMWLGRMLHDGEEGDVPDGLTWVDSLRSLFEVFQARNDMDFGGTVFDGVPMLHFLKFSLVNKGDEANPAFFFCFSTQFDDTAGEQEYIDDMYKKYGALMEVVWRHCEGFTKLLKEGPDPGDFPSPPDPPGIDQDSYELSDEFLDLVRPANVDRDGTLCFYNSNRDVSSPNVKTWRKDSQKLGDVFVAVGVAHEQIEQGVPCQEVLDTLLQAIDPED